MSYKVITIGEYWDENTTTSHVSNTLTIAENLTETSAQNKINEIYNTSAISRFDFIDPEVDLADDWEFITWRLENYQVNFSCAYIDESSRDRIWQYASGIIKIEYVNDGQEGEDPVTPTPSEKHPYAMLDENGILTFFVSYYFDENLSATTGKINWNNGPLLDIDGNEHDGNILYMFFAVDPILADITPPSEGWWKEEKNLIKSIISYSSQIIKPSTANISKWFYNCAQLTKCDLSGFDVSSINNAQSIFDGCVSLQKLILPANFPIGNRTNQAAIPTATAGKQNGYFTTTDNWLVFNSDGEYVRPYTAEYITANWATYSTDNAINGIVTLRVEEQAKYAIYEYNNETDKADFTFEWLSGIPDNTISPNNWYDSAEKKAYFLGFEENTDTTKSPFNWDLITDISNPKEKITSVSFPIDWQITPQTTAHWFEDFINLENIYNFSNLIFSNVTSAEAMFKNCSSLTQLLLVGGDPIFYQMENCTNFEEMFSGCSELQSLDLYYINNKKTEMESIPVNMFEGCTKLQTLGLGSNFKFNFGSSDSNKILLPPHDAVYEEDDQNNLTGRGTSEKWIRVSDLNGNSVTNSQPITTEEFYTNYNNYSQTETSQSDSSEGLALNTDSQTDSADEINYGAGVYVWEPIVTVDYKRGDNIIKTDWATQNRDYILATKDDFTVTKYHVYYTSDIPKNSIPEPKEIDIIPYSITDITYMLERTSVSPGTPIMVSSPTIILVDTFESSMIYPPEEEPQEENNLQFIGWRDANNEQIEIKNPGEPWDLIEPKVYAIFEAIELILEEKVRDPQDEKKWIKLRDIYKSARSHKYIIPGQSSGGGGSGVQINDAGDPSKGIYIDNGTAKELNYGLNYNNENNSVTLTIKDGQGQPHNIQINIPTASQSIAPPDNNTIIINENGMIETSGTGILNSMTTTATETPASLGDGAIFYGFTNVHFENGKMISADLQKFSLNHSAVASIAQPTANDTVVWINTSA